MCACVCPRIFLFVLDVNLLYLGLVLMNQCLGAHVEGVEGLFVVCLFGLGFFFFFFEVSAARGRGTDLSSARFGSANYYQEGTVRAVINIITWCRAIYRFALFFFSLPSTVASSSDAFHGALFQPPRPILRDAEHLNHRSIPADPARIAW